MSHGHGHDHGHDAGVDGVVLDIGGDVGAAVVVLDDDFAGDELDVQPVGRPADRFHTGIHRRPVGGTQVRTAVFPAMTAGRYELLDVGGRPVATLDVAGGHVAFLQLTE